MAKFGLMAILLRRMMITRKQIAKAIKEETGLDAEVWVSDGSAHFFSDTDDKLNCLLGNRQSNCVMVCKLNHQSLADWVEDFKGVLNDE